MDAIITKPLERLGGEQGVHIVITSARSRITSYRDFADRGIKWKVSTIRLKVLCDNPCCRVAID